MDLQEKKEMKQPEFKDDEDSDSGFSSDASESVRSISKGKE